MAKNLATNTMSSVTIDCRNVAAVDNKKHWSKAFGGKEHDFVLNSKRVEVIFLTAKNKEQVGASPLWRAVAC
jgi:hypothetical protein